ncbi:MAG: signal peptidase II [Lachnospiraceae bacterium]|jgi:signal peptidase II
MKIKDKKYINAHMVLQILLFLVLIAVDRLTKILAVKYLKGQPSITIIKNILELQYLENTGAAFGIFQNKQWLFYIITVAVLAVLFYMWFILNRRLKKYCRFCEVCPQDFKLKTYRHINYLNYLLAVLSAGAIGNFVDRIVNKYVVDFICFKIINFPIFNFADICVTVTAVLLMIFFIFMYKDDKNFTIFSFKK